MELNEFKGDLLSIATAFTWAIAVLFYKGSGNLLATIPLKFFQNSISFVLFVICILIFGEPLWPNLTPWEWGLLVLSAVLGITLGDTLYIAAIKRIGAGPQALLDCLYSPFIIFFAFFIFNETLSPLGFLGAFLIVVAIGIGNSVHAYRGENRKELLTGLVLGILSQVCMAACVLLVRDILRKDSVLTITTYRFFIGTALMILPSVWKGTTASLLEGFRYSKDLRVTLPGTILGPFLSTLLWFAGFKYTLAGKAAVYNQLSTIFIIVLAAWFLGEPLTRRKIWAVLLSIAGGILVSL